MELLSIASDSIARVFNLSGATCTVALDILKPFDRFFHAGLIGKRKSYRISGQVFGLILSLSIIGDFEWV